LNLQANNIRNILFVGHQGSGKTTLVESLHSIASKSPKGSIERKNTISDYTPEEKNRLSSCNLAVVPITYNDYKLNLIDAPGNDAFIYEIIGLLNFVKGAVLVIDATKKVEVGTVKHFNFLKKHGIPTLIYIAKMDKEFVDYNAVIEEISAKLGKSAISFVYPIGREKNFDGFINVVTKKASRFNGSEIIEDEIHDDKKAKIDELHNVLAEQVALTNEEMLEKFFSGEPLSEKEIHKGLHTAVLSGDINPILVGSATNDVGLTTMLSMIIDFLPAPNELKPYHGIGKDGKEASRKSEESEPFSAYVFKTMLDQYKGTTNLIKVCSGTLKSGDEVYCPNNNETYKVSQMFFLSGNKQIPVDEVFAGDIVSLAKLDQLFTGHSLCDKNNPITYPKAKYPTPVYYKAVSAKTTKDEEKLGGSLHKLQIEDPCLEVKRNVETKQLLIGGLSNSHLAYILEKINNIFNIEVDVAMPKINYRETIKKEASAPGRYVKQSGGSGFYGVVEMTFMPSGSDENIFEEKIFGGAVPKNYIPAVEKGFFESVNAGLLAGFPVLGMKALLIDGKYHSVDSNELAFKMAAILAYKEAYHKCSPTILEPIMKITINVHNEFTGNIMNDLNQRRARIMSIDEVANDNQEITALVPEAEILDYVTNLNVLSQGTGYFNRSFDSYQEVPANLIDNVIRDNSMLAKPENK
jgi:elongation factor G